MDICDSVTHRVPNVKESTWMMTLRYSLKFFSEVKVNVEIVVTLKDWLNLVGRASGILWGFTESSV